MLIVRLAGNYPGLQKTAANGFGCKRAEGYSMAFAKATGIIGDSYAQRQTGARTRYWESQPFARGAPLLLFPPRISAACKNAVMDESTSLWALFASSFLAATLLPGGSEVVLFGVIKFHPQLIWQALAVATLGNTLGGMSSYLIGRLIPPKQELKGMSWVQRYGAAALLLAWVPIIGDPLCVAAGWLRINPWLSALCMALGKLARYLVVVGIAAQPAIIN